jgi:hypothetical protein
MILPSCLASCKIAWYSSPQNPNLTHSSSGSHFSATWVRSSLPFKKRSNVPSSLLTSSRTDFRDWLESFPVRLTRHPKSIMSVGTILRRATVYRGSCRETSGFGNRPVRCSARGSYRKCYSRVICSMIFRSSGSWTSLSKSAGRRRSRFLQNCHQRGRRLAPVSAATTSARVAFPRQTLFRSVHADRHFGPRNCSKAADPNFR